VIYNQLANPGADELALLFGHSLVNCSAFSALNFNNLACFKDWA
jgi:hypothetical protein